MFLHITNSVYLDPNKNSPTERGKIFLIFFSFFSYDREWNQVFSNEIKLSALIYGGISILQPQMQIHTMACSYFFWSLM